MKKDRLKIPLITLFVHSLFFFIFPSSLQLKEPPQKKQELRIVTKEIAVVKTLPIKVIPTLTTLTEKTIPIKPLLPKKKEIAKKSVKNVKEVRGKLEKNVAKIQKKSTPPPIQIPSVIPTEVEQGDGKYNYLSLVSSQLQEWLVLPEKGEVKLTITVQPNGKIVNIKPLSSESDKNLEYLKHVLEGIQLPVYEKNEEITFSVIFCDEK